MYEQSKTSQMLYEELKNKLTFCKLTTKRDEINIRCPFCGDSQKDLHKGHLYINTKPPFKYYCQRCQSSGVINSYFLKKLQIVNSNLLSNIDKDLFNYQKNYNNKYKNEFKLFNNKTLNFIPTNYGEKEEKRLLYFINRLGIEINEEDLNKYRIILNFDNFFKNNNIDLSKRFETKYKVNYEKLNYEKIKKYCIGFLSMDKSTINCRSIDEKESGFRYKQFTIFPNNINSKKIYSINNKIDLSLPCHNIILSEGVMDIIGIYNHIFNKNNDYIYMANNGKNYITTLDYLSSLSLLNANITIFSDKDVPINEYQYIMEKCLLAKFNGLNIYYNKLSKDYGVTKNKIKLSEKLILK